ncbi:(ABC) transporter [Seminavis robusta]|uniref:(ABC) transporter n=1 Tax=Seminavis robusta TaxID=568900 RepID=A0A9N8E364_9STRA|nr:(ABC) transporter [Seminavis robusta]|eukprot:Sro456_g146720.1 (ABC) transporter (318) ;mRNA; f:48119-49072
MAVRGIDVFLPLWLWLCLFDCGNAFSLVVQQQRWPVKLPVATLSASTDSSSGTSLTSDVLTIPLFERAHVTLDQVSLQYPVTLARRLFSSVPRRDYAIHNVSLELQSEIVLLQGASSSGKSALMKLMAGHEEKPTSGSIHKRSTAVPIWLADKPPYDNQNTVQELLERETQLSFDLNEEKSRPFVKTVISTISTMLQLDPQHQQQTPAQLSPSENYKLRLALACLQSSLPRLLLHDATIVIPAPILLLDEWLDLETQAISSKVQEALLHLVTGSGAIVVCATHKPHLWKKLTVTTPQTTQITMCRGEILTLQQKQEQ